MSDSNIYLSCSYTNYIKRLSTAMILPLSCLLITACGGSDNKSPEAVSTATQKVNQGTSTVNEEAKQAQIDAQQAQIEAQKAQIEAQKAQLEAKNEQLQKKPEQPAKSQTNKPKTEVKNSPKLSMKSEQSLAIIKNFFEKGGKTYVTVDFVQYIEPSDNSAGGIKNVNPKLRTYEVNKSAYPNCTGSGKDSVDAIWTEWEALKADELLYKIKAKNGKVIELYLSCAG